MVDDSSFTTTLQQKLNEMRHGDVTAVEGLFQAVDARMRNLTQRMLRRFPAVQRWVDADDVMQNASLRLWRSLESVRPATSRDFVNLAAVQIRRELIDLARRFQGPRGIATLHESVEEFAALPLVDVESVQAELQQWTDLHLEAGELPEIEREVFDAVFYHGRTQKEVAELLNVDVRTVRRRWASAILQLQQTLDGFTFDD